MANWEHRADSGTRGQRRRAGLTAGGALVALALLLAACGQPGTTAGHIAPFQPPNGWHNITPPTGEPMANYAVSPDVPGLIVACIGDQTAHTSAAPVGPAHIWRSRDGGATWQRLAINDFYAGCDVALPAGGHGTIFAGNFLSTVATAPQFIEVSHDQGNTWTMLASNTDGTIQPLYDLLARGVYRDGQLDTTGQLDPANPGSVTTRFSATRDDGRTWTTIEAAPDPLLAPFFTVPAIAADQSAPGAWFRVLGRDETWFAQPGSQDVQAGVHPVAQPAAMLEHSSDGGRTWTVLGPVGPVGTTSALAYSGPSALALATLATMPGRVCAAFEATVGPQAPAVPAALSGDPRTVAALAGLRASSSRTGPPYMPPTLTALAASDDGGRTWTSATVMHHTHNGGNGGGLAMDAAGTCYTADDALVANPDPTAQVPGVDATVWRLAAGSSTPQQIAQVTGSDLALVGVTTAPGDPAPRVVAVITTPQPPVICGPSTCPTETPHPPHLVWTAGG